VIPHCDASVTRSPGAGWPRSRPELELNAATKGDRVTFRQIDLLSQGNEDGSRLLVNRRYGGKVGQAWGVAHDGHGSAHLVAPAGIGVGKPRDFINSFDLRLRRRTHGPVVQRGDQLIADRRGVMRSATVAGRSAFTLIPAAFKRLFVARWRLSQLEFLSGQFLRGSTGWQQGRHELEVTLRLM